MIDVNTGRNVGKDDPRGDHHQDQPRGRRRGRPPAPPARHRRHHHHRLHRHGRRAQPRAVVEAPRRRRSRATAPDLRRRHLAARPGGDDAPEHLRRPARDHDRDLPDLRRRGGHPERRDPRDRHRARAARSRCAGRAADRSLWPCTPDRRGHERRGRARLADLRAEVGVEIRLEPETAWPPRPCASARSTTRSPRRPTRPTRPRAPARGGGSPPARAEPRARAGRPAAGSPWWDGRGRPSHRHRARRTSTTWHEVRHRAIGGGACGPPGSVHPGPHPEEAVELVGHVVADARGGRMSSRTPLANGTQGARAANRPRR